ncbi:hypothetical protein C8R43DRAFT_1158115 [Mycena crocata]|nr:hypothetical protein C8R43DRAFT_1158115 [Mycena crocata]
MRRGFLKNSSTTRTKKTPEPKPAAVPKTPTSAAPDSPVECNSATSGSDEESPESEPEQGNEPPFDPHRPPEWLIEQHPKGETRFIFRTWPRASDGETAANLGTLGKMAPNGIPWWGATLYDFYMFQPIPDCPNYMMTSTGSRLAAKMRELGELEAAAPEIAWADREEDPRPLVLPEEIARDIEPREDWVDARSVRGKENDRVLEVPLAQPATGEHCDISSIAPENYPGPWPFVPFSSSRPLPKLETLIPYTLLPKKLIVHDPWSLLSMHEQPEVDTRTDWTAIPDITHTYELAPPTEAGLLKSAHQHDVFRSGIHDEDYVIPTSDPDPGKAAGPCSPYLRIKVPPYPHKTSTPAAHLYISPASKAGVGHHSAVYNAEWELPRSLLVPDVFCRECVFAELTEMGESGELRKLAEEALAGSEESCYVTQEMEITPEAVVDLGPPSKPGEERKPDIRIVRPRMVERTRKYHGPIVDVHTKVQWQTPGRGKNCFHIRNMPLLDINAREYSRPPTATVRVCAKLSIQDDTHLLREAKVYQAFPAHLSEHWSGYNLVGRHSPSRNPVPLNAVVPQFYGLYVPKPTPDEANKRYLSPVMLLENCGTPLEATMLSPDQKKECWSLIYRLHDADWVHESVAERNIMMQAGPLTVPQGWMRGGYLPCEGGEISFRVIDFGRSLYCGPAAEEKSENTHDVYQELRGGSDIFERMRMEKVGIDKLLSQGFRYC